MHPKPQSKYERLQFLSSSLAKLLEKSPPTYYDETPLATWIETVDRVSGELAKELGGNKSLSVALSSMAALQTRAEEAQAFCQEHGLQPGEYTWFAVLDYAKSAATRQTDAEQRQHHAERAYDEVRESLGELEAEVARLKDELVRAPRRFKTV